MSVKQKVLDAMKPKVKQFGFTKKVAKSIAAEIADKLDIANDASDEDVGAAIDTAIDAALPYFSLIQSQANGLLEEWRKKHEKNDDEDEGSDEDNSSDEASRNRPDKSTKTSGKTSGESGQSKEMRDLMNAVSALSKEIASMKEGKTMESRRSKLEALLKDSGSFGNRTLKSFSRMSFKDDDDYEEFLSGVKDDLEAFKQELAENGLSVMGNPPGGKGERQERHEEAFSDDEIDALAD